MQMPTAAKRAATEPQDRLQSLFTDMDLTLENSEETKVYVQCSSETSSEWFVEIIKEEKEVSFQNRIRH